MKTPAKDLPAKTKNAPGMVHIDNKPHYCGVRVLTKAESGKTDFPYDLNALAWQGEHEKNPNVKTLANNLLDVYKNGNRLSTSPHTSKTKPKMVAALQQPPRSLPDTAQEVVFHCGDIIGYTALLSERYPGKKIAILNPANRTHMGGGAFLGANALEEIYFRCSDLAVAYAKHAQDEGFRYQAYGDTARPDYDVQMGLGEAWYTSNITFTQKPPPNNVSPYVKLKKPFSVAIIGSTAPHYKDIAAARADSDNENVIKNEIRAQLTAAIENNIDIPVLTAFGCGAFNNDPAMVANYYWEVLYGEGYAKYFDQVEFAIWQDPDPKMPQNYETFFNVFKTLAEKSQASVQVKNYQSPQAEMMKFHNNFLVDQSGTQPQSCLTPEQQSWLPLMEECQKTVKIYNNSKYAHKVDKKFNKPGKYSLSDHRDVSDKTSNLQILADDNLSNTLEKLGKYSPEWSDETNEKRQYTKYRVIYSELPFMTPQGLKKRKMITTCAPNFMGTSPFDAKKYLKDGNLNVDGYAEACNELAALIVFAAKENNMYPLDIAEFGLGAYLNAFAEIMEKPGRPGQAAKPEEAEKARNIMYSAFFNAARHFNHKIQWVLWEGLKDSAGRAVALNKAYNDPLFTFKTGNILDSENSLNNGSDRTIGGKMACSHPGTTEEQVAQNSMLIQIQSEFNPSLYNQEVNIHVDTIVMDIAFSRLRFAGKISLNEQFAKVEFSDAADALKFAASLHTRYNIHNFKNEGLPINMTERNGKYFVRLRPKDFNACMGRENAFITLMEQSKAAEKTVLEFIQTHRLQATHEHLSHWAAKTNASEGINISAENKTYKVPPCIHKALKILHDPAQHLNPIEKVEKLNEIMKELVTLSPQVKAGFFNQGLTADSMNNPALIKNAKNVQQQASPGK